MASYFGLIVFVFEYFEFFWEIIIGLFGFICPQVYHTGVFYSLRPRRNIFLGREWWMYHLSFLLSSNGKRAWRIIIPEHFPGFSFFIIPRRARESTRAVELRSAISL
jgi:hypothetical protein